MSFNNCLLGSELELVSKKFNLNTYTCPARSLNFPFDWSNYSVGIVSSFSLFIPKRIIDQLPLINIHPSLLPQWRGPAPIQYTLLKGQRETGVSIIDLHPKIIDAGSILLQSPLNIPNHDTIKYPELEDLLASLGGSLAAQVLSNFQHYWNSKADQQGSISQSKKITKQDGIVSFKTDSFDEISRKIRALSHQIPIKTLDLVSNRQVILEDFTLNLQDGQVNEKPFYYDKSKGAVIFKLADGKCIGVKRFKIDGKSQTFSAGSFYSNFLIKQ